MKMNFFFIFDFKFLFVLNTLWSKR